MTPEDAKRVEEIMAAHQLEAHPFSKCRTCFLLRVIEEQGNYIRERQGRIDEKVHEAAEVMEGVLRQVGWTAMSAYEAVEDWLGVEWDGKLQDFVYPDGRRVNPPPFDQVTTARKDPA